MLPLEGTYLVWVDCRASGLTSDELETKLLEEAKLRINPGAIYGEASRDFIRLNIACRGNCWPRGSTGCERC